MNKHMSQRVIKQVTALAFALLFIFALFHYSFAQEEVLERTTEVIVEENSSEMDLQETPQTEEVDIPEQTEEDKTIVESIIDFFSPEPEEGEFQDIQQEGDIVEYVEEETVQEFPMYVPPSNLPELRALPEIKDFTVDIDAPHACWIADFSVDMQFLPNKTNKLIVSNPTIGPSMVEIVGIPPGFDIYFEDNNLQTISINSNQKEIPFSIEKNGKTQKGNFNVVFVFTKTIGKNSTTTCQMNLVNS